MKRTITLGIAAGFGSWSGKLALKKIMGTALLSFLLTEAHAQTVRLQGKVVDQRKTPMELVYLTLLSNDSTIVQKTLTDSLGRFSMKAESAHYRLVVDEPDMELLAREMDLYRDTDLGEIVVRQPQELQGVTIAARKKRVEQKVDRLVFYVENSTAATGGTALDALKATPTVKVQNEQVSIIGKGEVLVMIDDRLQRMSQEDLANFLKTIPADNIKSIEVITTPPAKYDAEGNNGLINIRLKKARASSWNANVGASYTQKTYAGGNVQGSFNYDHRKLSVQLSVNCGKQKLLTTLEEKIFFPATLWDQAQQSSSVNDLLSLGTGIDYKLTPKWTTGIRYLGSYTGKASANDPLTTRYDQATQVVSSYIRSEVSAGNRPGMSALSWYHSLALDSSGKSLTIDLDYFLYNKKDYRFFAGNELDQSQNVIPNTFFSSTSTNLNRISNYSAKADVSLPYRWADVSLGAKVAYTHTGNDLVVYDHQAGVPVLDTDQSNMFSYREHNEALYASAAKKLSSKWQTQVGLRMEATQTEGYSRNLDQRNASSYVRLFPTAYVSYGPNDKNAFSLSYSRRIRRPDFDYLNPFLIRTSPYYYSEGNPFLKPAFVDNLELSCIRSQKWVSSVYYSRVTDMGQDLSIVDPVTNITRQMPLNYADTYTAGISTYYNFSKWSWWNSFSGVNLNYQRIRSKTAFIGSIGGYNGYLYSNNDFTLNKSKTVFLGVNYGWQLPGRYQVFHLTAMHMLDISVKCLFLDKKLSLALIGEDILNGQRPLITYMSNGIKNTIRSYGDTRGFRVSVSYKFGNSKLGSSQRNAGNEEEKNRTE